MQFIDLASQQKRIHDKIEENIQKVLNHGKYIMGPEVRELETELSEFTGAKYGIACSSGTDALLLALLAFNVGPPGDAIITTPFTFIATAEVISLLGATPVFVDIDAKTYNITPEKIEKAIAALLECDSSLYPLPSKTNCSESLTPRGIIAVDIFGLPADYDNINDIAKKHDLFVIEDAAQSFGAEYKGKKACSLADIGCTSFFPAKPLGCYGDGGMCFTDNDDLAEAITSLRVHGKGGHKYDNIRIGVNARIDTIQAAILLAKHQIYPEEIVSRQKVAKRYSEKLSQNSSLTLPFIPEGMKSVWAQYSLLAKDENHRSIIQERLKNSDIPTAIYYPKPLHLQTAFLNIGYQEGDFPICEEISKRIFSIPMHSYLSEKDQNMVIKILNECG